MDEKSVMTLGVAQDRESAMKQLSGVNEEFEFGSKLGLGTFHLTWLRMFCSLKSLGG